MSCVSGKPRSTRESRAHDDRRRTTGDSLMSSTSTATGHAFRASRRTAIAYPRSRNILFIITSGPESEHPASGSRP